MTKKVQDDCSYLAVTAGSLLPYIQRQLGSEHSECGVGWDGGSPILAKAVHDDGCRCQDEQQYGGKHGDPDVAGVDVRSSTRRRRRRDGHVLTAGTCHALWTTADNHVTGSRPTHFTYCHLTGPRFV